MYFIKLAAIDVGIFIFLVLVCFFWRSDYKTRCRMRSLFPREGISIIVRTRDWVEETILNIPYPKILGRYVSREFFIISGMNLEYSQFLSIWWLFIILGNLTCILFLYLISDEFILVSLLLVSIYFSYMGPYLYLKQQKQNKIQKIEQQLPFFLDMLIYSVEAGMGLYPALGRINQAMDNYLRTEIDFILKRVDLGFSIEETLRELKFRVPTQYVDQLVEAIISSRKLGTPLARTLRIQSGNIRSNFRQKAEHKARTAPIRIIPALVFFFLPGLLLIYLAPPIINLLTSQ